MLSQKQGRNFCSFFLVQNQLDRKSIITHVGKKPIFIFLLQSLGPIQPCEIFQAISKKKKTCVWPIFPSKKIPNNFQSLLRQPCDQFFNQVISNQFSTRNHVKTLVEKFYFLLWTHNLASKIIFFTNQVSKNGFLVFRQMSIHLYNTNLTKRKF